MICHRCGYCCTILDVAIINPASILPDGTVDQDDLYSIAFKPAGQKCPHLLFEEETAVCIIHHLPCYRGTPCEQFEQFGPDDSSCTINGYFKSGSLCPEGQQRK